MSVEAERATSGQTRRQLEQQREHLLRSIEDLDAERAAGDVSDADYSALRSDYTARAAAVLRAMEDHDAVTPPESCEPGKQAAVSGGPVVQRRQRRRRRWLLWGGIALCAAAAVVLVAALVAPRLPGQTSSGTVRLSSAEQLQRTLGQAQLLESKGNASQALALYHEVLMKDPTQEQALAESGWLEFEAGVSAHNGKLLSDGQAAETEAEQVDPTAYAPHLYLGSMLLVEGHAGDAASEFSLFLQSDPPLPAEQTAWPFIVRAFTGAGRPVPPSPAGVSG